MWELEKALLQQAKCSSVAGDVLKFLSSNSPWIYSPTLAQWIALFWRVQQCLSEDFCRRSSVCSLWAGEWTYSSLGFTDILRQRLVTNLNMLTESRMRMYVYLWGVAGIGKTNHHMRKRWKKMGMNTLEARRYLRDLSTWNRYDPYTQCTITNQNYDWWWCRLKSSSD